jgi:hypothetical protein
VIGGRNMAAPHLLPSYTFYLKTMRFAGALYCRNVHHLLPLVRHMGAHRSQPLQSVKDLLLLGILGLINDLGRLGQIGSCQSDAASARRSSACGDITGRHGHDQLNPFLPRSVIHSDAENANH